MLHTNTPYSVAAVARALDVLCAFERPPHEFGASELARLLGMTKNHTFLCQDARSARLRQPHRAGRIGTACIGVNG